MTKQDYLNIILEGYVDNKDNLAIHLYRQCKKAAEKELIDNTEFFQRLWKAYELFEPERERQYKQRIRQYNHRLKDVYYQEITKDPTGALIALRKKVKEPIQEDSFCISNGRYTARLKGEDLTYIKDKISEAEEKIQEPKKVTSDRPTRLQALISLYKKKGKDLTSAQVYNLAEKYKYDKASMLEFYRRTKVYDKIKKAALKK